MNYDDRSPHSAATDPACWLDVHGDALYAYALARVRERSLAEDLVQETLLAALSAPGAFRGESAERTWLVGILKHKLVDHLRRAAREQPLPDGMTDIEELASYFDDTGHWSMQIGDWGRPERALEQEQFRKAFNDCLDRLPERLRLLYTMRELEEMETDELTRALDITSANVWVMLSRARLRLRQCLETTWAD
jgi:RNA polymerase sigma-70 factor (ECF subfamily)